MSNEETPNVDNSNKQPSHTEGRSSFSQIEREFEVCPNDALGWGAQVDTMEPGLGRESVAAEDFQELIKAAMEKLAPEQREHKVALPLRQPEVSGSEEGNVKVDVVVVDLKTLHRQETFDHRRLLVDTALGPNKELDAERLLVRIKQRMNRVGVEFAKVEVRFSHLSAAAGVYVGERSVATVSNVFVNAAEYGLAAVGLMRSRKRKFTILNSVSGVLKPGRMTLLLGPPGSGKSTLLKLLAGVAYNKKNGLQVSGDITYNGETFDKFQVRRTSAYIDQVDNHMAEFTVRETLDFAARCQGPGHAGDYLQELALREKDQGIQPDPEIDAVWKALAVPGKRFNVYTEILLRVLGLQECGATHVGNQMLRGISGGQMKRLTTGEALSGPKTTLFMDEISTGLDSSTTYLITKTIRDYVHMHDATVMMALLQPPPETFDLFDDIMLLSEGHIVYYGPRERVLPFFSTVGFCIPQRKAVADFLQEVTSRRDQQQYWCRDSEPYRFIPVEEFAQCFQASAEGAALSSALADDISKGTCCIDPLIRTKFALTGWQAFKACFRRDWTLMQRHSFLYVFKAVQLGIIALLVSAAMFRTTLEDDTISDGFVYLSVLFYTVVSIMFNGYAEMALMIQELPIFFKHREAQFFPGWSYALPTVLLRLPLSVLDSVVWAVLVYWLVGLAASGGRFFIFIGLLILLHSMAISLFRLMGAVGRTATIANSIGSMVLVSVILLGGFILVPGDIPSWWIWFYWANPLMYAQQGLSINEFLAPRWQDKTVTYDGQPTPLGEAILRSRSLWTDQVWVGATCAILVGFWALFTSLLFVVLQYTPEPSSGGAVVSEKFLEEREFNRTGKASGSAAVKGCRVVKGCKNDAPHSGNSTAIDTAPSEPLRPIRDAENGIGINSSTGVELQSVEGRSPALGVREKPGGMALPFTPMAMVFHNMSYFIQMGKGNAAYKEAKQGQVKPELQLLTNISGTFRPGVLTALVGVSGAGKTTLMDVLAGRKTEGRVEGDMYVGGYPKEQTTFARVCGYVEQNDIHSPLTTVREALHFSSFLRLYGVDRQTATMFADEVMDLLELSPQASGIVGLPGVNGLSVEQRKRLTIAVELVANPSIVFMDEPTSGLDARAAAVVMRAVRNTVNTGRTVVCTIHQPSIDVFEAFDELLLLRRGGRTIYHGPLGEQSCHLIDYFQSIPGVPAIREGLNPATWMLEVSTSAQEKKMGIDLADTFLKSSVYRETEELIADLSKPVAGAQPLHFDDSYARNFFEQSWVLIRKSFGQYWRNPAYNAVRLSFTVGLAFVLGSIYWRLGSQRSTVNDISNIMGALFICIIFLGTSNASSVQPVVFIERGVYYRERAAKMYSPLPYSIAQGLVEWPYILFQSVLYALVTYWMVYFEATAAKFFWYLLFTYITLVFFTFYGMMAVAISPVLFVAAILSGFFYSIWFLFGGFLITYENMPPWVQWYYWLNPMSYCLYGIIGSQLGDVTTTIQLPDGGTVTVKQFLKDEFGIEYSFVGVCVAIMLAFIAMFWAVIAIAHKRFNFQKR